MKQLFKYILLSLLAGLIFYGGAGVNWVTYCSNGCLKKSVQTVVVEDHCNTYGHTDEQEEDVPVMALSQSVLNALHNCSIERVEFKWTSFENKRSLILLPFITDALYQLSYTYLLTDSELLAKVIFIKDDPPSILPPREYLTLLTTLLI